MLNIQSSRIENFQHTLAVTSRSEAVSRVGRELGVLVEGVNSVCLQLGSALPPLAPLPVCSLQFHLLGTFPILPSFRHHDAETRVLAILDKDMSLDPGDQYSSTEGHQEGAQWYL